MLAWLTKTFAEDTPRLAPSIARPAWRSLLVALVAVVPVMLAVIYLAGEPGPGNGTLEPDYPGAAVLAGRAAHVPVAAVLPSLDQIRQSVYRQAGCLDDIPVSTPSACAFGDTANPVRTVALVGDSAAGQWFDALDAIAVQRHWKLVTELHSSCPWTAAVMLNSNGAGTFTACHAWGAAVLHDLVATIHPDVVITSDYPNMATPDHPAKESSAAVAEIGAGMARYWTALEDAGISVTTIKESPDMDEDVPACVEKHSTELARCDVPRSTAIPRNSPVSYAAKLMRGNVAVVDANSLICGPEACAPVVGNILVYSDRHQLTWYYSKSTAQFIEPLLLKANKILAENPKRTAASPTAPLPRSRSVAPCPATPGASPGACASLRLRRAWGRTVGLGPWCAAAEVARMDRVRTSDVRLAAVLGLRHGRAQALLLPLLTAGVCGLFPRLSWLVALPVAVLALLRPGFTARLAPYALAAYGAYGLFFAQWLAQWNGAAVSGGPSFLLRGVIDSQAPVWGVPPFGGPVQTVIYGVLRVGPMVDSAYVRPEAFVILAAATWLLAVGDGPGSGAVRRAFAQLRGAGGQPKTVPPLVLGTVVLGLAGLVLSLRMAVPTAAGPISWFTVVGYGPLTLYGRYYAGLVPPDGVHPALTGDMLRLAGLEGPLVLSLTAVLGLTLLAFGGLLATRWPGAAGATELAEHTQALTRRVTRLTETRRDATETAAAELRRIERDLHDGAQARLVAVGMSLRAAEQLMPADPEGAMALVAEARETSSRALDDLRDLVRGIYPPVLADRGLPDAVRALALDAPLAVHTEIDLPADPPMPVAAAAYFAVAEALANAVRHAGAATVGIAVTHADGMLRATVTDDGRGGADPAQGTGLAGVERRLATFDGTLTVSSPPGGPTVIAIEIPYAAYPSAGGGLVGVVRSSWQTRTLI